MTKDQQIKLTKIFSYCQLLINEIDDIEVAKNETTQNIFDKAKSLQDDLIDIVDQFYQNRAVSKTTDFLELQGKIEYQFNKTFKK